MALQVFFCDCSTALINCKTLTIINHLICNTSVFITKSAFCRVPQRRTGRAFYTQVCCNSFVVLHSAAEAELWNNLHNVSELTKELFKNCLTNQFGSVQLSLVIIYLVLFVSALVYLISYIPNLIQHIPRVHEMLPPASLQHPKTLLLQYGELFDHVNLGNMNETKLSILTCYCGFAASYFNWIFFNRRQKIYLKQFEKKVNLKMHLVW